MNGIKRCLVCKGAGDFEQTYTIGCGMGTHKSLGPCDWCEHPHRSMKGAGYTLFNGDPLPDDMVVKLVNSGLLDDDLWYYELRERFDKESKQW